MRDFDPLAGVAPGGLDAGRPAARCASDRPTGVSEPLIEAKRRIDAQIPPGYRDAAKKGVGGGADGGAGDYLVWHQSVVEATRRDLPLGATGDEKEDWWWALARPHGPSGGFRRGGPAQKSPCFYFNSGGWLFEHADALQVIVSQEAVAEVEHGTVDPTPAVWSSGAVRELLRRFDGEGREQADVIREAAAGGGRISREKIYEIAGYSEDRMLRGITRRSDGSHATFRRKAFLTWASSPVLL